METEMRRVSSEKENEARIVISETPKERIYLAISGRNPFHPDLVDISKMKFNKDNGKRELMSRVNFSKRFLAPFIIELVKIMERKTSGDSV